MPSLYLLLLLSKCSCVDITPLSMRLLFIGTLYGLKREGMWEEKKVRNERFENFMRGPLFVHNGCSKVRDDCLDLHGCLIKRTHVVQGICTYILYSAFSCIPFSVVNFGGAKYLRGPQLSFPNKSLL